MNALVTELVVGRLARPDAAAALTLADDGAAQQALDKVAALRTQLNTAADQNGDGIIDGEQLARITRRLRPQLEQHQQLARSASTAPDLLDLAAPDIALRRESLPLGRRRGAIDLLLSVEVRPPSPAAGTTGSTPRACASPGSASPRAPVMRTQSLRRITRIGAGVRTNRTITASATRGGLTTKTHLLIKNRRRRQDEPDDHGIGHSRRPDHQDASAD
jgi:hypothetical protein